MVKCKSCRYSSGFTDGIILCEFLEKKICVTANHSCKYGKRKRMKDLIERQAAIDAVKKNTFRLTFAEEQNCEGHLAWSANAVYSDVIEGALLELPSAQPKSYREGYQAGFKDAQPERKRGRWNCSDDMYESAVCSVCGWDTTEPWDHIRHWFNYCPHCGADMREVDDGSD